MSELAASVDASETLWEVDAIPDPEFGYYTVGSEIVRVIAGFPASTGYAHGEVFPAKIRVFRGTNGTTAASHLSGAALTAANAFSGGGGGGSSGFVVSATDPGAVGPGVIWKDISGGLGASAVWSERNAADDGWEQRAIEAAVNPSGDAFTTRAVTATGGNAFSNFSAAADNGDAHAGSVAIVFGDTPGVASNVGTAIGPLGTAGFSAESDAVSARLAFNGVTPIAIPVLPATPTAQDIADALVALGLVTQAP